MSIKKVKEHHMAHMEEIFESFNYHIFEKLVSVDSMMATITKEAGLCGVPEKYRIRYVQEKIIDMIDQIAENREGRK
ncbi:hypothetical protein PMSD_22990 [Paenibacillus macquariensis subsp. defensor]|nr:hypothetical protein PMSD_22990 [Paenibacillus macquariensis subsp. defensor]